MSRSCGMHCSGVAGNKVANGYVEDDFDVNISEPRGIWCARFCTLVQDRFTDANLVQVSISISAVIMLLTSVITFASPGEPK